MNKNIQIIIGIIASIALILGIVNLPQRGVFGGSTSANWVIEKNLTVNGTSTLTGTTTMQTAVITGTTTVDQLAVKSIGFGGMLTATTATTVAFSASDICDYSYIAYNASSAGKTGYASATLPTAATLIADCLGQVGMLKDVLIHNAYATPTVLAAGTGMGFYYATGTSASGTYDTTLSPGEMKLMRFFSTSSASVGVLLLPIVR